jgi:hypothetical protein
VTRSARITAAHAMMMYWRARYRSACSALAHANGMRSGKARKGWIMKDLNKSRACLLDEMLSLRIAYTYPKEPQC